LKFSVIEDSVGFGDEIISIQPKEVMKMNELEKKEKMLISLLKDWTKEEKEKLYIQSGVYGYYNSEIIYANITTKSPFQIKLVLELLRELSKYTPNPIIQDDGVSQVYGDEMIED